MKTPCLCAFLLAVLLQSACGRSTSDAPQPSTPVETPPPATLLATLLSTPAPPTEIPVPSIPPSPLEAALAAAVAEYGDISGTLPITIFSQILINDSATRDASYFATQTAWAALPLEIGTPTVPAPRDDGLNPDDPGSWARYIDPTGFSFDYLVSQDILYAEPTSLPQAVGGSGVTTRLKNGEMIRGANEAIGFSVFRGENPFITEKSFPANMASPQGEPHFAVKFDFIGATHAWMYLFGDQNTSPNPVNLDY